MLSHFLESSPNVVIKLLDLQRDGVAIQPPKPDGNHRVHSFMSRFHCLRLKILVFTSNSKNAFICILTAVTLPNNSRLNWVHNACTRCSQLMFQPRQTTHGYSTFLRCFGLIVLTSCTTKVCENLHVYSMIFWYTNLQKYLSILPRNVKKIYGNFDTFFHISYTR